MTFEDVKVELVFQEIPIPLLGLTQGKLVSANPVAAKPTDMSKDDWALSILGQVRSGVRDGNKSVLAVPRSFWPLSPEELQEYAKSERFEFIDLMDEWDGPHDFGFMTPVESVRQIIDHLRRGKDVTVLSHTKRRSDFVRAVLFLVAQEHAEHPAKLWCGIAQEGQIELTQFQRGYVYGLINATGPCGLEQLKEAFRYGRVGL